MATEIIAPAHPGVAWLADRGLSIGARVGSCRVARRAGTVVTVTSPDDLSVRWDDGRTESVRWTAVSPFGYVVEVAPEAAPTPAQWASAAMHLERREDWLIYRVDGVRYIRMISGHSGKVYAVRADAAGCGCAWYQRTGRQCSHMLAVSLAALEDELRAELAVVPLVAFRDLYPGCAAGCGALAERRGALCDRCCAERTRRLELASKRAVAA